LLTPFSIALVLSAALLHASWNALLRGGADRTRSMSIMCIIVGLTGFAMMAVAGLPVSAAILARPIRSRAALHPH
jgi:hypothetical protein